MSAEMFCMLLAVAGAVRVSAAAGHGVGAYDGHMLLM